ncbi:MAG: succinic semialdehyde dehydrogenase [Gemmatimonadota bacterium]
MEAVRSPFTGEVLAHVPALGADDVKAAVDRARAASVEWRAMPAMARAGLFECFQNRLLEAQDEILDIVQLETGKARAHAFEEVADVVITTAHYAKQAPGLLEPKRRRGVMPGLTRVLELRKPHGVVGIIAPWNYPLSLGATDAIPALLAGNAVVLKPDLQTTHTALWIAEKLSESGLPADLFRVVSGSGLEAGAALVRSADYVAFTGSTETGRIVAAAAGERLVGASLELGGKNAMIVRGDADLERAVEGALQGCFSNAGQLCLSIERIYVHRSMHDAFLARFSERTAALRLGTGLHWGYDVGSLSTREQFEKVSEHVDDAVAHGVTVRAGGHARPEIGPWFFEPTVLTGVTPEMRLHSEETFGPVATVRPFETDDEAVELVNDSRYGLNASIWSRDRQAALALARRIETGTVNINEAYAAAWGSVDAPMGGMKDSGVGRRHGRDGLLRYTQAQTIAVQRGMSIAEAISWARRPGGRRITTGLLRFLRDSPRLR